MISEKYHLGPIRRFGSSPVCNLIAVEIRTSLTFKTDGDVEEVPTWTKAVILCLPCKRAKSE